jgi:hypothetical protein
MSFKTSAQASIDVTLGADHSFLADSKPYAVREFGTDKLRRGLFFGECLRDVKCVRLVGVVSAVYDARNIQKTT